MPTTRHFSERLTAVSCNVALLAVTLCARHSSATPLPAPTGQSSDIGFGVAVTTPGDLDGDGWADFVCGATTFEAEGDAIPGRVYVYRGGPGIDASPDFVLVGQTNGDRFGYVVAGAGDLNSDTHPDLVVGAYQSDANGTNSGAAYVFFGGPAFDAVPDLVLVGGAVGDQFGIAVDGVGDVNDDTYDDLLVGARFHASLGFEKGRAYVFFGGPALDNVPDLVLDGESPGERFGFTVARAGDVNDDSHADFIVGAYHNSVIAFETGRVYVYFGGPGVDAIADLVLEGEGFRAHFSDGLGAADVNGDNESDIFVGASQINAAKGRAYVFFGGASLDAARDLVIDPGIAGDWFGRFVSGGGDLDGDGFGDLVIGAPARNSGGHGRAYFYSGGPTVDATDDGILFGEHLGDNFGWNGSASASDLDADGNDDFVVGAFRNDNAGLDVGRAYVFSLHETVPVTVTDLGVAASDAGVVLSWRLPTAALHELAGVHVERADEADGAYSERTSSVLVPEVAMTFTDSEIEPGHTYWYRLALLGRDGPVGWAGPVQATASSQGRTALYTPFVPRGSESVAIRYRIGPSESSVELVIYDVQGRCVRHLENSRRERGDHLRTWDRLDDLGARVARGVYVILLTATDAKLSRKLVLVHD